MAGEAPNEFDAVLDGFSDPQRFASPTASAFVDGTEFGILSATNPGGKVLSAEETVAFAVRRRWLSPVAVGCSAHQFSSRTMGQWSLSAHAPASSTTRHSFKVGMSDVDANA
jgi:hypothetical protein